MSSFAEKEQSKDAARHLRQRRGSAIFVVMVMLALITTLCIAYIQMVRAYSMAAKAQTTSDNSMTVVREIADEIAQVLGDDIVNSNGEFFSEGVEGVSASDPANIPGIEVFDFPFTNTTGTENRNKTAVTSLLDSSSLGTAFGGHLDDAWLAATAPDFSTGIAHWDHITNLRGGVYLAIPIVGAAAGNELPLEYVLDHVTSPTYQHTDTNLNLSGASSLATVPNSNYQAIGVDADGDGIVDSRWTWATLPQIGGVSYVMAVRIVDLSSLINLNTATGMTQTGDDDWSLGNTPRGVFPSGADLSRLFERHTYANWDTELATAGTSLFAARGISGLSDALVPLGITDITTYPAASSYAANTAMSNWMTKGRYYDGTQVYKLDSEFELRYSNGLNKLQSPSTIGVEVAMSNVLHASSSETTYTDTGASSEAEYFQGGTSATDVNARSFDTVRHMLTTMSGAAIFAPDHRSTTGGAKLHGGVRTLQYDLVNKNLSSGNYTADGDSNGIPDRVEEIRTLLSSIFSIAQSGGSSYFANESLGNVDVAAHEFALAIQDYSDANHAPTGAWLDLNSNSSVDAGEMFYGLEMLPFLREVYIQAGYEDDDRVDTDSDPTTFVDFDTWIIRDGVQVNSSTTLTTAESLGMVVEIGNPFDKEIPNAALQNVKIVVSQGGSMVSEYQLSGLPNTTVLPSRNVAAIYSNPSTASFEDSAAKSNLGTDLTIGGDVDFHWTLTAGTLKFNADQQITVELQVDVGGGTFVTYDRLTDAGLIAPSTYYHGTDTPTAATENRHLQGSVTRDGQKIRYISNTNKQLANGALRAPTSAGYKADTIHALGLSYKGFNGDFTLDTDTYGFQLPVANRPLLSVAELGMIHMFGFTDGPDGDFPHRFSGGDSVTPLNTPRRFLVDGGGNYVAEAPGITYLAMVMDQFTTLSLINDGVDNDGSGADGNDEEQFVPGRININTVPLHLGALTAPIAESISSGLTTAYSTEELMQAIVDYRNGGLRPASPYRQGVGIASIGELFSVAGATLADDMQAYGWNGLLDSNSTTPAASIYPTADDVADLGATNYPALGNVSTGSPEGRLARFHALGQLFTTRSDLYAAYILVHGYPAANYTAGPVETKSVIVVFDRSAVTSASSSVRILGIYEVN